MKARPFLPLVAALAFAAATAHAIQLGDPREDVLAEMGQPSGEIGSGDLVVLFFDRGEVHLRDGRVSAINLVTAEELAARKLAEAEELERMREARAARQARREAEGNALYARKKNDFAFQSQPAAEQLRFWRWFASQYPMVSVEEEVQAALAKYEQQQRLREIELANNQRIAELEQQLADAERRADRAERHRYYGYPYAPYYARRPVIIDDRHRGRDRDGHRRQDVGIHTSTDLRSQAMSGIEAARDAAYQSVSGTQTQTGN